MINLDKIIIAFMVLVCFSVIAGTLEKPFNFSRLDRPSDLANLNSSLEELYSRKQEKSFRIVTSTPTASDMDYNEVLYLKQTGNVKTFFKDDDGTVYCSAVMTSL